MIEPGPTELPWWPVTDRQLDDAARALGLDPAAMTRNDKVRTWNRIISDHNEELKRVLFGTGAGGPAGILGGACHARCRCRPPLETKGQNRPK